jgi:uncharacterized protein YbjT (DUF2867 family)
MTFNVVMLGATGAVGGQALLRLINMKDVASIITLSRRAIGDVTSPKVKQHIVDVIKSETYSDFLKGHNVAICTFGVGEPSKASREEFQAVDHDAVLAFATACKTAGIKHFELLGAVMADPNSRNFYIKSKGQLREAIAALGFERFSIFQPSMILTPQNRYGLSQGLMLALWPWLSRLLQGDWQKYRGVRVEALGAAIANNLTTSAKGFEILHWPEISKLSSLN